MSQVATLLLRLEGPLQSWGYRSRFKSRDTGLEPSKSGVIGLLCCALGRDRSEPPTELAQLKMHVRVDRPGHLLTDFHTAGGGNFRGSSSYYAPTSSGNKGKNPIITEKQYLSDAAFLVALEGPEPLIQVLAEGLADPVWPLNLGRRSCPPTEQVLIGVTSDSPKVALETAPAPNRKTTEHTTYIWEVESAGPNTETRQDVPISWTDRSDRVYGYRETETTIGEWPK